MVWMWVGFCEETYCDARSLVREAQHIDRWTASASGLFKAIEVQFRVDRTAATAHPRELAGPRKKVLLSANSRIAARGDCAA
jgi:hypothetical protein